MRFGIDSVSYAYHHALMRTWDTGYSVANAESLKETDSSPYQSPDPLKKKTLSLAVSLLWFLVL